MLLELVLGPACSCSRRPSRTRRAFLVLDTCEHFRLPIPCTPPQGSCLGPRTRTAACPRCSLLPWCNRFAQLRCLVWAPHENGPFVEIFFTMFLAMSVDKTAAEFVVSPRSSTSMKYFMLSCFCVFKACRVSLECWLRVTTNLGTFSTSVLIVNIPNFLAPDLVLHGCFSDFVVVLGPHCAACWRHCLS